MTLDTYFFLGTMGKKQWSCTSLRRTAPIVGSSGNHFALCTEIKCLVIMGIDVNEMAYIPDETSVNVTKFCPGEYR